MIKRIEIVEDKDKELVLHRFKNKIRYYKYIGSLVVFGDAAVIALLVTALVFKKSNAMNVGIFLAVVAAFTIPVIMFSFNKVWQLGSDIESQRVQILTCRVDRIKVETVRKRKFNIFFVDRKEIRIDDEYCEPIAVNDRINITQGISSRIPIIAARVTE